MSPEGAVNSISGRRRRWRDAVLVAILLLLGLAVLSTRFAYEPFNIPSGSMYPTLVVGDHIFVSKFRYGYGRYSFPFGFADFEERIWAGPVARGDVAVFRHPQDDQTDYIKRVVGMPGERIQIRDGILHIDGTPVTRERIADYAMSPGVEVPQYLETLPGGRVHPILETNGDQSPMDSTPEFIVPKGHYFMLGDNRDNSADSRVIGPVPYDYLIGRAEVIFYSGRLDRIFQRIE